MKIPAPHQLRVLNEYADLDAKVEALAKFIIDGAIFVNLPEEEKERLRQQYHHMFEYRRILADRIKEF